MAFQRIFNSVPIWTLLFKIPDPNLIGGGYLLNSPPAQYHVGPSVHNIHVRVPTVSKDVGLWEDSIEAFVKKEVASRILDSPPGYGDNPVTTLNSDVHWHTATNFRFSYPKIWGSVSRRNSRGKKNKQAVRSFNQQLTSGTTVNFIFVCREWEQHVAGINEFNKKTRDFWSGSTDNNYEYGVSDSVLNDMRRYKISLDDIPITDYVLEIPNVDHLSAGTLWGRLKGPQPVHLKPLKSDVM